MKKRITFFQALRAVQNDDPEKALKATREYFSQPTKTKRNAKPKTY